MVGDNDCGGRRVVGEGGWECRDEINGIGEDLEGGGRNFKGE